jgi:hypothetical protein
MRLHGSIGPQRCRYPPRDASPLPPPPRRGAVRCRATEFSPGPVRMSALPADGAGAEVLVPHWLTAAHRVQLATAVRQAMTGHPVHPVAVIHLEDVLTELHVAAARDAVWPASAARVRLATGWDEDVLPVRLSAAELASVLALSELPNAVRGLLTGNATA